jgi:predicted MFS family arabinose efflux permease
LTSYQPRAERDSNVLTNGLVLLLASACGISVANLYYAQPLLHSIASRFHSGPSTTALIVTGSQVGYALGLALLVPIGDMIARRRLVPIVLGLTAVGLVLAALAPNIGVLIGVCVLIGIGSVAAQMLVPLAASLADESNRGAVVGKVMSGLLIGILLARTLAGLVANAAGWRTVYWAAAAMIVVLAVVLAGRLPRETVSFPPSYRAVLRSVVVMFATEPLLRKRATLGALAFGAFSVFWTTVAFVLAGPPYHYSESVIGLFGLVGAAGAICANVAGRLADRGYVSQLTSVFSLLVMASFGALYLGRHDLWAMILGIVLLDVGVQGMQVTNQSVIYRLAPDARSRVNSAYMVVYFIGGAIGSALAGRVYAANGWTGVSITGAAIGGITALLVVFWSRSASRSKPTAVDRADRSPRVH